MILGDFNVDYFDINCHSHPLMKILKSFLFSQQLKSLTRPTSGKCLDHIWTNKPNFSHQASTRDIYISDHLPIQCVLLYLRILTILRILGIFFLTMRLMNTPLVSKRVKKRNQPLWITDEITTLMRRRDFLL